MTGSGPGVALAALLARILAGLVLGLLGLFAVAWLLGPFRFIQ